MKLFSFIQQSAVLKYKRWNRRSTLTKRQLFVLVTLLLTALLVLTQLVPPDYRFPMVFLFSFITYGASAFALREDLSGIEWVTLLTLPSLFSAAVSLFYFLLPVRWLTRIPIAILYAVGMYGLLLTENIYNIAANRTIALLRAAHSVGFLVTLITYYFLIQTVFALRLRPYWDIPLVCLISFILYVQILWSVLLERTMPGYFWYICLGLSVALSETGWIMSFLPVSTTIVSLFLTTCFYSTAGILQQYFLQKFYKRTLNEFMMVALIVLCIVFVTTKFR